LDTFNKLQEQDMQKDRFLTFMIDKEIYGIEINYVTEIVGIQAITEMPEMPDYIKGIINLRGVIIPVMDVRLRFKKESKDYDDRTCVIVVDLNNINVGLVVDSVSEVLTIAGEDILEVPKVNASINNKYLKNIGKCVQNVILILDCENLISEDELSDIKSAI
jgi:purine-binding chemotaxis protein CheW